MYLRTSIETLASPFTVGLESSILTIGSCFSDFLGEKLEQDKFSCLSNPFGTLYNPVSIAKLLRHSMQLQTTPSHLFWENEGIWYHHDYHSQWWAFEREELEKIIEKTHLEVHHFLRKTQVVILTLGTAYVHKIKPNLNIVSNCHKRPAQDFKKELLSVKETVHAMSSLLDQLLVYNGKIKVILTVSPVRHTRETLQGNSLSKSILRVACHELAEKYAHVSYFPSYEIMIDDLRDYRFFQPDLIHPNEVALDYIFDLFKKTYVSRCTQEWLVQWQKVKQGLTHRPLHPGTSSHRQFLAQLKTQLDTLGNTVNLSQERDWIDLQLNQLG